MAALAVLLPACSGGSSDTANSPATERGARLPAWVKQALSAKSGPDVAVTMGSADFAVGDNRLVFLMVRSNGALVQAPTAGIEYALAGEPPRTAKAVLQPLGAHEHAHEAEVEPHDHLDATDVYVAHVRTPKPGRYWFVADPADEKIQAVGTLEVQKQSVSPALGAKAPASNNPTLASATAKDITTARPPDTGLLRYSIADSIQAQVPFVVVFATPEFCVSRVCGPTVEVVEKVANKFDRGGVRFIHVEIYKENDPKKGFNRWVQEWNLPTEPWVFLVDSAGVIRGKFEGAVSVAELESAVREDLLAAS
jgi:hypothetical protein